jgi:eukaryotic-like serine/threonine-protein kinase
MLMERIGKYEIRGQLGRGGMGAVYRAYDTVMEREVAIKVILDIALDVPEIKERFYREARTAGKLSHDNITIVHDVGEDNGRPYIVMEYLTGSDLRTLLERQEPMSALQKIDIAIQICRGLAFSHSKDVVHRDIKPANIRILSDGRVKIMDFGIARLGSSALTSTGAVMGTPYYMSPEVIQGKKADRRSDIFSCGVLLFELFTSQKQFRGEEPTSVMYKIVDEEPEGIDELPRLYPEELSEIIGRMLRKDPAERCQNLDQTVRELEIAKDHLKRDELKDMATGEQAATMVNTGSLAPSSIRRGFPRPRPVSLLESVPVS